MFYYRGLKEWNNVGSACAGMHFFINLSFLAVDFVSQNIARIYRKIGYCPVYYDYEVYKAQVFRQILPDIYKNKIINRWAIIYDDYKLQLWINEG